MHILMLLGHLSLNIVLISTGLKINNDNGCFQYFTENYDNWYDLFILFITKSNVLV